jgi:hypothetical protein
MKVAGKNGSVSLQKKRARRDQHGEPASFLLVRGYGWMLKFSDGVAGAPPTYHVCL